LIVANRIVFISGSSLAHLPYAIGGADFPDAIFLNFP
jgi:hypothetical protein